MQREGISVGRAEKLGPAQNGREERAGEKERRGKEEALLGTTIMSIKFKNGVILGADTRTSMGTYVSNRVSRKITKLFDRIYTCRSGSAADTQAVSDVIVNEMQKKASCYGETPSVKDAAILAKKIIYQNPHLTAGMIVAGVDSSGGRVFSISLGGTIIEQSCALAGSGSIYITGLCDASYREDMEKEEAVEFVKKAVFHAMYRDNSSGGCIRMRIISHDGSEEELFFPERS